MRSKDQVIKPYGDAWGDGQVQLSFTLPIPAGAKAMEAAKQLATQMGFEGVQVTSMKDLYGFSHFILYGSTKYSVDLEQIAVRDTSDEAMSFDEVNAFIESEIGRKIVVVGACTGTDAHTVGLDAIMNMKGFDGDYGLERYPMIEAHNLGSQVPNEVLLRKARELKADAVLVSQVVTQKNVHIQNLTELVEMAEAEGLRRDLIMIVGGPRIDRALAAELGYDAGFGPGTTARHVSTFLARELVRKL